MADRARTHTAARLDELLVSLSDAEEGGLKLDTLVAYALAGADLRTETLRDVMTEGSFSLDVAGELLDDRPPPFSRTLDAAIPGENIVLATYSNKRNQWAAVQREADGREFMAWAATEPLARRVAALQAYSERQAEPVANLPEEKPLPSLKSIEPETLQSDADLPRAEEPMVKKITRGARPNAPEWRIKF
ncbi:MAG: hypothetical protein HQ514_11700 [Rhodospirillales bacterium]|nr:hypothetical protein [Rhodospirillales bacterium]